MKRSTLKAVDNREQRKRFVTLLKTNIWLLRRHVRQTAGRK